MVVARRKRLSWRDSGGGQPEATLSIEAKLIFPHGIPVALRAAPETTGGAAPSAVAPQPSEDHRVGGLYGRPGEDRMIYPWQLGADKAV